MKQRRMRTFGKDLGEGQTSEGLVDHKANSLVTCALPVVKDCV